MTVLKKAVLDSTTTEVARKFQFQAFDLDGNGTISKSVALQHLNIFLEPLKGV